MARKQFSEALAVADKLGKDPAQHVLSLALRGEVFLAENKLDDALASYQEAAKLDPKSEFALYGSALILQRMKRFDEAAKNLHAFST